MLVLQFRGDTPADLDAIVSLEGQLMDRLAGGAHVDGHDVGSGETNIFIHAKSVTDAFESIKPVLERAGLLDAVVVASRPMDGERYSVIWPSGFKREFRVAYCSHRAA